MAVAPELDLVGGRHVVEVVKRGPDRRVVTAEEQVRLVGPLSQRRRQLTTDETRGLTALF